MRTRGLWIAIACTTGLLIMVTSRAAEQVTPGFADLSGDWTNENPNTKNPNGVWQYRQGDTKLPLISPWTAGATAVLACAQPAWAPSNVRGRFLPALFMANACTAHTFGADPNDPGHDNVLPGDVVMHTVDSFNGDPTHGQGNYTFASKREGAFSVTGMIWNAAFLPGRPQAWLVLHNDVRVASGSLDGRVSRIQAQRFDAPVTVHPGDTVRVEFARASGAEAGYFVGVNLSVVGDVAQITVEGDRIRIALDAPVLFDFDRSDLRPSAEAALLKVKRSVLDQHQGARVLVEGHTDDRGAPDHNMKLSTARAQSVTTWLEQHGTPVALLQTKGLGSSRPKVPNTSDENRSRNRRVEISVLK